jgi:hypothetical protein
MEINQKMEFIKIPLSISTAKNPVPMNLRLPTLQKEKK